MTPRNGSNGRPPRNQIVLIIEDDPRLRELFRRTLAAVGHAVVAVEDGLDALRRIDDGFTPDAVVLDLALPRLGGLDFYQEVSRGASRRIPVVVVTGTDTAFDENDFASVLRKPVDLDALIAAIDDCLRSAR